MLTFVGIYLIALAIVLIVIVFRDHAVGRVELVSVRNVAIAGFILFQLTSGAMSLFLDEWGQFYLSNPVPTSLEYAAMCTVFLIVAFWAYNKGWVVNKLAAKLPTTRAVPGDGALLAMAVLVTALALVMRFALLMPLIGPVAVQIATGLSAVACGLVGWVWAKRIFNPVVMVYVGVIFVANLGIVMYGSFGRRGLVAIGAGLLWGMFYSTWRYLPMRVFLKYLMIVAVPPVIVLALFTSVRDSAESNRTTGEHIQAIMTGGQLADGMYELLAGQGTAAGSMWLLESHPQDFSHRHLFTVWNFFIYPVPRAILGDLKPDPIGIQMPALARMQNVQRHKLNIGPGIIGNAGCEGGWYALIVYAVLGGLFLRFFDQTIRLNPYSPFFVIPIGSALGQILGLARGETSAFAFLACLAIGGSLVVMVAIGKAVEKFVPTVDPEQVEGGEYGDEWDEQEAEGYEQPAVR